jgi:hypothetical protein
LCAGDLVLDLGGVNLNDITTAAYSGQLDLSRFDGRALSALCGVPWDGSEQTLSSKW